MRLGVIGGMGPLATARYMELVVRMTDAQKDQDHLEMIVMNIPTIPDRTASLLGQSQSEPLNVLITNGNQLKKLGAEILSLPCITAQCYRQTLEQQVGIPVLDPIQGTVHQLRSVGIEKVGLLATTGTINRGVVNAQLHSAQIQTLLPAPQQQESLMSIIYQQIKAGLPANVTLLNHLCRELRAQGAQAILLGCTELSLIKEQLEYQGDILDMLEVLARNSVQACGKPLRNCYQSLLGGRSLAAKKRA